RKGRCVKCFSTFDWEEDMSVESQCPDCQSKNCVRPDIVWFGEMPYFMDVVYEKLDQCDLFVAIGTSGQVYPAAGFVQNCQQAKKVEINLKASSVSHLFDELIEGPASQCVPQFVVNIMSGRFTF